MGYDEEQPLRPPLAVTAALRALRASFTDYRATLTGRGDGTWHFEVIRVHGDTGPWCLISQDPREIYDALSADKPGGQDT